MNLLRKLFSNTTAYYQYNMDSIPDVVGYCSNTNCPCKETPIPKGTGYLYISPKAVSFMKDLKRGKKIDAITAILDSTMPILMCEQGARLQNIDMQVAADDAKQWWETGKVPLRPTPNNSSSMPISTPTSTSKTPLAVLIVANGQVPSQFECDTILDSIPEFQGQYSVRPIGGGAPLPDQSDTKKVGSLAAVLVRIHYPQFINENISYLWRDGKLVIAVHKK